MRNILESRLPLQNRVAPDGTIHAVDARGTMLGNRGGKFHKPDQTLGRRRWASHHWICCELHYKNMHHEQMGQGYTSLFFLDEVTALAAGHRPCGFCRRRDMKTFVGDAKVETFDRTLHVERLSPHQPVSASSLPDGVMVEVEGTFWAKRDACFLRWSFDGYTQAHSFNTERVRPLTPPTFIGILRAGYQPRWHSTALQLEQQK